jgi:tetratricopeptide (TPR) repeat protein
LDLNLSLHNALKSIIVFMKKITLLVLFICVNSFIISAQTAIQYYNKGIRKTALKDYVGAKKDFEKAIELDPNYAFAHNNLALILIHNFKDRDGAKMHYEKAISLDKTDAISHYNYAILLRDKFLDRDKAKTEFEKSIALDPKLAMVHYNYAVLLKDNFGDKETAKRQYMIATSLNSKLVNPNFDVDFEIIRTKIDKF